MPKTAFHKALVAIVVASGAVLAQDATFKTYGFMDVMYMRQSFEKSNFLLPQGTVFDDAQAYVDHLNTYMDWKPNSSVRVLAEISFSRDPIQKYKPGTRLGFDSASVYGSVYGQVGSTIRSRMLAYLQANPATSSLPAAALGILADSLTRDTLSKTVHQVGMGVRAESAVGSPSRQPKDHGISIPRVHADLLLRDEFNIRVGKFVTPAGIWNVDHGSPTILTVKQPYETSFFPIFPESQTGVQAFGKGVVADQDFSYAAWVSTGRPGIVYTSDYASEPENLDDWAWGGHVQADLGILDGIRLGSTFYTGTIRQTELWTDLPVTGFDVARQIPTTDLAASVNDRTTLSYMRDISYGLDTKIEWAKFLVQAEWNHRKLLNLQAHGKESDFNAWYVLVGRTFAPWREIQLTPYAMYETISWENPRNNPGLTMDDIPIEGFQTYLGGVNIGFKSCIRLKLEYSHVGLDPNRLSSGPAANNYSSGDLSVEQFATQLSVAF